MLIEMVKVGFLASSLIVEEKLYFHHCVWCLLFHVWNKAFHTWLTGTTWVWTVCVYLCTLYNKYTLWSYMIHSWLSPWVQNCRCRGSSLKLYTAFQLFRELVKSLTALFKSKVYGFCYLEVASFYSYVAVFLWWEETLVRCFLHQMVKLAFPFTGCITLNQLSCVGQS